MHEQQTPSCPYHHSLSAHGVVFSSFVLVNSVAMEGDGCTLCRTAEAKLVALSHRLNCSQQVRSAEDMVIASSLPAALEMSML